VFRSELLRRRTARAHSGGRTGDNGHLIEATGYSRDTLEANAVGETAAVAYIPEVETYVRAHPLVLKESRVEEDGITFLGTMQDEPWSNSAVTELQQRSTLQRPSLDTTERARP
jgi:hypothetical protein